MVAWVVVWLLMFITERPGKLSLLEISAASIVGMATPVKFRRKPVMSLLRNTTFPGPTLCRTPRVVLTLPVPLLRQEMTLSHLQRAVVCRSRMRKLEKKRPWAFPIIKMRSWDRRTPSRWVPAPGMKFDLCTTRSIPLPALGCILGWLPTMWETASME